MSNKGELNESCEKNCEKCVVLHGLPIYKFQRVYYTRTDYLGS